MRDKCVWSTSSYALKRLEGNCIPRLNHGEWDSYAGLNPGLMYINMMFKIDFILHIYLIHGYNSKHRVYQQEYEMQKANVADFIKQDSGIFRLSILIP